jgi:hypothetical protein
MQPPRRSARLGQRISVNGGTKFSGAFNPANLAGVKVGSIVEVSGFRTSAGALSASSVQISPSSFDRIVGTVSRLDGNTHSFYIGALRVNYANASLLEGHLANGVLVEVQGPRASGTTLIARSVKVEDEGLGGEPGDGASIEGLVTSPLDAGFFSINGQVVIIKSTTVFVDGGRADLRTTRASRPRDTSTRRDASWPRRSRSSTRTTRTCSRRSTRSIWPAAHCGSWRARRHPAGH